MKNFNSFEKNLNASELRNASKPNEPFFVHRYLYNTVIHNLARIRHNHPGITADEMNEILFNEIDDYSQSVYEISHVFVSFMEYISAQYLLKLKSPDINPEELSFYTCSSLDECLYVYRYKKQLFDIIFDGYTKTTPENAIHIDDIIKSDLKPFCKHVFGSDEFADLMSSTTLDISKKKAKVKEYSLLYPVQDRRKFLTTIDILLRGSIAYLAYDKDDLEFKLREDLSQSIERIVNNLEAQNHLKDYMVSYASQMVSLGFPEMALPFCEGENVNLSFLRDLENVDIAHQKNALFHVVNTDKLKKLLSVNYLSSGKSISIGSLFALNSFWSNRYIKELDVYAESMFAVHEFDLVDKIVNGEKIDIPIEDIEKMLIKMNTFYRPACYYINTKNDEVNSKDNSDIDDEHTTLNGKIIRYSYDDFISSIKSQFGDKYFEHFSKLLPNSENNIEEDADWFIRLYNPIISSYQIKDYSIKALISGIEYSASDFVNAGIILDTISKDGTFVQIPSVIGIGFDAGLTSPVRVHVRKDVLLEHLKSLHGNSMIPIYAGSKDFNDPLTQKPLPVHIVSPMTDKHVSMLKKASKNLKDYKNPNLVAHLGFLNSKFPPMHLRPASSTKKNKKPQPLQTKYVDLETGLIHVKENDTYIPVIPTDNSIEGVGNHEH